MDIYDIYKMIKYKEINKLQISDTEKAFLLLFRHMVSIENVLITHSKQEIEDDVCVDRIKTIKNAALYN